MRDPTSLEQLVHEHLPAALRFATRLTGDADRAEDLLQESLLRAVRSWRSFRGQAAFRTWLFRIVINVFRDRLQRSHCESLVVGEERAEFVDATHARPPEAAMAAELGALIAREIALLPPRQREVLVLIAYEGLSAGEAAHVVGISEANVHSTLWAARVRLKTRLAPLLGSVEKKP